MLRNNRVAHVLQGQHMVSDEDGLVLSTVLGSCVAACFHDPIRRIGGMNHFLLPGTDPGDGQNVKYGAHAMESLINAMLRAGADRRRIEVKLFGGANVVKGLSRIGDGNATFARKFAMDEGFRIAEADLGGEFGRRIYYTPTSGLASVRLLDRSDAPQEVLAPRPLRPQSPGNSVEFF